MNPPIPPFTAETAAEKARLAEDAWNTRDPARVVLAYTSDSRWRNRAEFLEGRDAIRAFLTRKWQRELDYRLIKEVWAFRENRIGVRFAYEWHDDSGNWFRSYGNENWEFDEHGLMRLRIASINDLPIKDGERKYHWPRGSTRWSFSAATASRARSCRPRRCWRAIRIRRMPTLTMPCPATSAAVARMSASAKRSSKPRNRADRGADNDPRSPHPTQLRAGWSSRGRRPDAEPASAVRNWRSQSGRRE